MRTSYHEKKWTPGTKIIEIFGSALEIFVPPSRLYVKSFLRCLKGGPKFSAEK